jgi:hypothetical protein
LTANRHKSYSYWDANFFEISCRQQHLQLVAFGLVFWQRPLKSSQRKEVLSVLKRPEEIYARFADDEFNARS